MKKKNKGKFCMLAALIVMMLSITVLQVGASRNGAIIGDISEAIAIGEIGVVGEVTYTHSENIPPEIASQLVNSMLGFSAEPVDMMIQPMSFWCIFSHDWAYGAIITTIHRAYSTNPRCREIWQLVRFCTRCSTNLILSESSVRMICC